MASITTILGTDSVSSSRIVINNNFDSLNSELSSIALALNIDAQSLTLTGLITGATLRIYNNSSNLFKVDPTEIIANLPIKLNQEVVLGNGLMHSTNNVTTLPAANAYTYTTYILAAGSLSGVNTLALADDGQEITLIANGGTITISNSNVLGASASVIISDGGSLTLRYITSLSKFAIISSYKCTVSGAAI